MALTIAKGVPMESLEQRQIRIEKMNHMKDKGVDPFGQAFNRSHYIKDVIDTYDGFDKETLLEKIKPAVEKESTITEGRSSENAEFVSKVTHLNIQESVQNILNESSVLKEMVDNKEIAIVGALHDIETGKVEFLN